MAPPGVEEVLEHLNSILASRGFAGAERMSRFLRFTVEMKLRGEGDQIKEFLLGREVFDRGADYDPRLDPIVRVEARRLRQRLEEYYSGPGRAAKLRIEYPKGSYAPRISTTGAPTTPRRRRLVYAAGAVVVAAIAVAAVMAWTPEDRPAVAVVPAHWVWTGEGNLDPQEAALAEEITAALANQGQTPVIGWPNVARRRGASLELAGLGRSLGARTIVLVSVRREPARLRVTLFALDAATGRKSLVREYFPGRLDEYAARAELARQAAAALQNL